MAQVVVRSDADQSVLFNETVLPVHLDDDHSALQLLERLAWAIEDADAPQRAGRERRSHNGRMASEARRLHRR